MYESFQAKQEVPRLGCHQHLELQIRGWKNTMRLLPTQTCCASASPEESKQGNQGLLPYE